MRKLILILLVAAGCSGTDKETREIISLAGEWRFRIDSLDLGIKDQWFNNPFSETVKLPGSMAENGKGYEVTAGTDWTGDIVDRSYFTDKKYEKYRQPGNVKIPFWLKPVKYYKGVAWYRKDFDFPPGFEGKDVILYLERCHWETTIFINGMNAGSRNGLSTPHEYDITSFVKKGRNNISIRIDNRIVIPIGVNSHSISDHTQSNWNGIIGDISLIARPAVSVDNISVFPDLKAKTAKVIITLTGKGSGSFKGNLSLSAEGFNSVKKSNPPVKKVKVEIMSDRTEIVTDYPMGKKFAAWSEFDPSLYKMTVALTDKEGGVIDVNSTVFGMREFRANGTRFEVNGTPVFLRGTTECCVFPLTGYPPTDEESWMKVLTACRDYGLNHVRFHSFCPPEAAFLSADKLGIYFHIECSSWANQGTAIGDGGSVDKFIYEEGDRILREYGNHPSFCMLAYGNEPAGANQEAYLGQLIKYWKSKDNRRVYTSGAGWPVIPENDYNLTPEPRIQHWGEGLNSIINREAPQTMYDFGDFVNKFTVPSVSHEIGQWCAYPDFSEIEKYTGVLKPTNFEIFRESLEANKMGQQAMDFLNASGKLQVLCYKADIEAALRTPGFAGFEILQLHDFPGQGTALVGILNPFFESKGYVKPDEFRMFCNSTVPLARFKKHTFLNNETFEADVEVAHFGPGQVENPEFICSVTGASGQILKTEKFTKDKIGIGNCIPLGKFTMDLQPVSAPQKLQFKVAMSGTEFLNSWEFWVYPAAAATDPGKVLITDRLDRSTEEVLRNGGSVLLLTYGNLEKDKGPQVAIGFSTIFWNTAWTNNQPPHTMGILCDPGNRLFSDFPTEYHSNWQWWDPVTHSQAMIIDGMPGNLVAAIQPIDTWFENRRLALAFEAKAGKGRIMVCSIDMKSNLESRPVTRQLLASFLKYMNSPDFNPEAEIDINRIRELIK